MHALFKIRQAIANRTLLVGSLFIYFACSGLACPDGNATAASNSATASAYITNASDNTVTSFSVDNKSGALTKTGTFAAGNTPVAVAALSIANQLGYVYVVNKNDNTVSQYSIGESGGLTPLTPPTVPTGGQPVAICLLDDSKVGNGRSIFVANHAGNTISYYNVNSDGTLALLSTFPSGGTGPARVSGEPGFIYVLNSGDNSLCKFAYTGNLATTSLASKLSLPSNGLAVDMGEIGDTGTGGAGALSQHLYVVDSANNTLSKYATDPGVSSLQSIPVANIPVSVAVEFGNGTDLAKSVSTDAIYVGSPLGYIYQFIEDTTPGTSTMSAQVVPNIIFAPQQVILRISDNSQAVVVGGSEGNPLPAHCLYVLLTDSNTVRVYSTLTSAVSGPITYDTGAINTATLTETPTGHYPSDIAFAVSQHTSGTVQTTVRSIRKTR